MFVVAITGGVGSGKSYVSQLFKRKGIPCVSADVINRELIQSNTEAYSSICQHFGQHVLLENKEINRAMLRKIVFSDPVERQWLEELIHPMIAEEMGKRVDSLQADYCLVEVPLLAEVGKRAWINRVLVIDAPRRVRIARVMKRDQVLESDVTKMMGSQAKRQARLAIADDVIDNKGDDIQLQIDTLHNYYLSLAQGTT